MIQRVAQAYAEQLTRGLDENPSYRGPRDPNPTPPFRANWWATSSTCSTPGGVRNEGTSFSIDDFGMKVVAEGVEYQEQRDFLAGSGCDQIQGYFYSRPLKADDAAVFPHRVK